MKKFKNYIFDVGARSNEFTYSESLLKDNLRYFKECFNKNLSAYKALLFFEDFINGDYDIKLKHKKNGRNNKQ